MSTYLPPESYDLIHGDINLLQIDQYLRIKDATELARLAATMATSSKSLSPQELIDSALTLQEEAEKGLIRKRVQLLSQMNLQTALEIARQLDVLEKAFVLGNDPVLNDPVKGPVVEVLKKIFAQDAQLCTEANKRRSDKALAEADSRTGIPRPSLPCNLEEALRYSIDAPNEPWPLLEKAFIDFLGIYQSNRNATQECDYRTDIEGQFKRDKELLADLARKAKTDQELQPQLSALKAELDKTGKNIDEWKKEKLYRECFTPALTTPDHIKEQSEITYKNFWGSRHIVRREDSLCFLTIDFYDFWGKHSEVYLSRHRDAEEKKRQSSRIKSTAGVKGPERRDHKRYTDWSHGFSTLLKKQLRTSTTPEISLLIKSFVDNESGLKDSKAKKKLSSFLATLTNPGNLKTSALDLLPIITDCGIRTMTERTIKECQIIINGELRDSRKKL